MDINTLFLTSIDQIPQLFKPNQLAYFSLTSKPEGELRDAIAFNLHANIANSDVVISREWKRTDLVALKQGIPSLIVEFKCAYTFDCTDNNYVGVHYGSSVIKDLEKSIFYSSDETDIYACLFLIHPLSKISNNFFDAVKYSRAINASLYRLPENVILEQAISNMTAYFNRWHIEAKSTILECGNAFETDIKIVTFAIGPLSKQKIAELVVNGKT